MGRKQEKEKKTPEQKLIIPDELDLLWEKAKNKDATLEDMFAFNNKARMSSYYCSSLSTKINRNTERLHNLSEKKADKMTEDGIWGDIKYIPQWTPYISARSWLIETLRSITKNLPEDASNEDIIATFEAIEKAAGVISDFINDALNGNVPLQKHFVILKAARRLSTERLEDLRKKVNEAKKLEHNRKRKIGLASFNVPDAFKAMGNAILAEETHGNSCLVLRLRWEVLSRMYADYVLVTKEINPEIEKFVLFVLDR